MDYLYNGVRLPQLPEWDKTVYPYAYLSTMPFFKVYTLQVSQQPADLLGNEESFYTKTPLMTSNFRYDSVFGLPPSVEWSEWDETGVGDAYGSSIGDVNPDMENYDGATDKLIWCNHDVTYPDGTVFLAASEPIPAPEVDLDPQSLTAGWLVGKKIAAMRGKKEPVAYLYNGVRLPQLPEWDKTVYPYAYIRRAEWGEVVLTVMSQPWYFDGTNAVTSASVYSQYGIYDGEWRLGLHDAEIKGGIILDDDYDIIWSNFDWCKNAEDDTVTFKASEPIPVY